MNKIGYTYDEILKFMTEGEGRGFLGRSMYDAIRETIEEQGKEIKQLKEEIKTLYRYTPEKGFELVGDEDVKD